MSPQSLYENSLQALVVQRLLTRAPRKHAVSQTLLRKTKKEIISAVVKLLLLICSLVLILAGSEAFAASVVSVSSSTPDGSYRAGSSIAITVLFDDAVTVDTGGGSPTLTLETGATNRAATYSGGSGSASLQFSYTVQSGDTSNDLTYISTAALTLNGALIQDSALDAADLTLPAPAAANSLAGNNDIVIDTSAPNVSSVTSSTANGTYVAGEIISIEVDFSEAVRVTGTPRISLETGSSDAVVSYSGPTNTLLSTLTFSYTVASGHLSADLEYLSTSALALNGGTIADAAGNTAVLTLPALNTAQSLAGSKAIVIDAQAPTVTGVTSTASNGSYGAGQTIDIQVDFSETVIVSGAPRITLETGASDATLTYSGPTGVPLSSLSFSYTVAAEHTSSDLDYTSSSSLVLNGGSIVDSSGNAANRTLPTPGASGSLSAQKNIEIDTTAPTLTISSAVTSTTNASPFTVTFTFSESVTGFTSSDIVVTNGSAGTVSGSGNTYTASITPSANGTVTVAVGADVISDAAGNGNTAATDLTRTYDNTAPTVTSVNSTTADGAYIVGQSIIVTVAVSEPVTVTGSPRLLLNLTSSNVNATYSAGSSTSTVLAFTYTVAANNSSSDLDYVATNSLTLNGGTIRDAAGNNLALTLPAPGAANSLGANRNIVVDGIVPTVSSVTSATANGTYLLGATINVSVNLSEPVVVTGTPYITLATTTNVNVNYSGATGTPLSTLTFTYTVANGHQSADLNYAATNSLVLNGGTIRDVAGNNATLTLPALASANSLGGSKAIVVDARAPTISTVRASSQTGSFRAGQSITITVNFSESVTVTGSPQLTLETGASDAVLTYSGASPVTTSSLSFTYTVAAGHTTNDLNYQATNSFSLNGATIVDAVNLSANVTLPALASANSLGVWGSIIIDTTAPTVSLVTSTTANGSYRAGQQLNVQVRFSENVTVTGTPQITLETGASDAVVNYVSTSSQNVNFTYTIAAGHTSSDLDYASTAALALNGGTIRDAAGNNATLTLATTGTANSLAGQKALVVDTTPPSITLSSASSTTASVPFTVTVTATESITGLTVSDFVVSNGAAAGLSGSGASWSVSIYPYAQGAVTIDLPAGTVTDTALNPNNASNQLQVTVQTNAPFVSGVSSSSSDGLYGLGSVIPIQITFSENVTVSGTPRLTLETGASDAVVNYSSGSGTTVLTFNYTVSAPHSAADLDYIMVPALSLNGGLIRDSATLSLDAAITMSPPGIFGSLGASKNLQIDGVAPTVTGVTSSLGNGSYRAGQVVPIQITFSEVVTVSGVPQLTLETGAVDAVVNYVSGSGSSTLLFNYTVAAGHNSNDLDYASTAALSLNGGTIRDAASNNATLTLAAPGAAQSLGGSKSLVIDTTSPQVSSVTSTTSDGNYGSGTAINVRVNFSEAVTVASDTPQVAIDAGVRTAYATYVAGTGSTTLDFTYTVQALDTSDDLAYTGTTALELNGATLRDTAGNDSVLTLAAPGAANSLNANKNIVIDSTAPTITGVTSSVADGSYTTGVSIQIQVQFSESVTVTGNPTLALAVGGPARNATFQSGSGTATLTFLYSVQAGDVSGDLDYTSSSALGMTGTTIRDGASNNAVTTLPTPGAASSLSANKNIAIDTITPTITSVAMVSANGAYITGSTIDFLLNFSEVVQVSGNPTVLLETGDIDASAVYVSGSGSASLTFRYTVSEGESSVDLDYSGPSALALNGGTISDTATNDAVTTLPSPGLSAVSDVIVDGIAPTISRVTSVTADGAYKTGQAINVRVIFSEAVQVTGAPTITLETGDTDAVATLVSGNGSTQLNFSFTVADTHTTEDLDYISTTALSLNGGTIRDAAGNDATITLATPGTTGWLGALKNISIDTVAPSIPSVTSSTADGRYRAGAEILITVNFNESVFVTGAPSITLATGGGGTNAVYQSGNGSSALTFLYTVGAGENSADLDCISSTPIVLNGGTIRDAAGNDSAATLPTPGQANSLGANKDIIIDTQAPTVASVAMVTADGAYSEGASIDFTVTFSETVVVSGAPTIALETGASDGTAVYTGTNGTTTLSFRYTVAAGHNSDDLDFTSASTILLSAGSIKDLADNDAVPTLPLPGLSSVAQVVVDTLAPTVTSVAMVSSDGAYKAGATIDFLVNTSEAVTVNGTPTILLETGATDATATYVSGSGSSSLTFRYTVGIGESSSDLDYVSSAALALNGGTIRDAVGYNLITSLPFPGLSAVSAVVIDGIAPQVSSVTSSTADAAYKAWTTMNVRVVFSEPVYVTGAPTITLETGDVDTVATLAGGSGTTQLNFTFVVSDGSITSDLDYISNTALSLNGGTIRDLAGNDAVITLPSPGTTGSLGALKNIVIDTINPIIPSVTSPNANGRYRAGAEIVLTTSFNEVVFITGTPVLKLANGGVGADAVYLSGDGTNVLAFLYTVASGDNSSDLDCLNSTPIVLNGGSIRDLAGNDAIIALPGPGEALSLGANKDIIIDTQAPTVASVAMVTADGTYGEGASIDFTVTFSETVVVSGAPTIALETGASDGTAVYTGTNGTTTLSFRYTVGNGHNSSDLDFTTAATLLLTGASIQDLAGNAAVPTLPLPGLSTAAQVVVDTINPTVSTVSMVTADGAYKAGDTIEFLVNFSESVLVNGVPLILLETGATDATATYVSGSGSSSLTFRYTVSAGELSSDLDYVSSAALALNGGSIRDAASNDADTPLPFPGLSTVSNVVVDTIRPTIGFVSSGGNPTNDTPISMTATFSEAVTGFDVSDISLTNATISNFQAVSSTVYTFDVTAASDGLVSVIVAQDRAVDAALNGNAATNYQFTFDSISPTPSLSSSAPAIIRKSSFVVMVSFTEPVSGFTLKDVTVSNGSATALVGSGSNYFVKVAPAGAGTIIVSIRSGAVVDLAGNPSLESNTIERTRETRPLLPPTISSPVSGAKVTTNSPTFSGTAEAEVVIKVFSGTNLLCTTTSLDDGQWTCGATDLSDGTYTIHATASDSLGNPSAASQSVSIVVDTIPLSPPILSSEIDTIVGDLSPTVSGLSELDTEVIIKAGATILCTAEVDSNGAWSCELPELVPGRYDLSATAYDSRDNSTSQPTAFYLVIGVTINGIVTLDDLNKTALAGATATTKISSTTSDSHGRFTVISESVSDLGISISKTGWRITQDGDPVENSGGVLVRFKAVPAIGPQSYALWDNHRKLQFSALMYQISDVTTSGEITTFQSDGSRCSNSTTFTTAANDRRVVQAPTDQCAAAGRFGLVQLESTSESYSAILSSARGRGSSVAARAATLEAEFSSGISGISYVTFDSLATTLRGFSQPRLVENVLLIGNVSDEANTFQIRTFSAAGVLQSEQNVELSGKSTARISNSVSGQSLTTAGTYQIIPSNPEAPYIAEVRRYGYQRTKKGAGAFIYASRFAARAGSSQELAFPIVRTGAARTQNFFEVVNVSDEPLVVQLSFEPSDSSAAKMLVVSIPPYGLTQVPFSLLLRRSSRGTVFLRPSRPASMLASVVVNFFSQPRGLVSSQALPLTDLIGEERLASFESRLGADVVLTNRSSEASEATLTCYSASNLVGVLDITVPPRSSVISSVASCFGRASSGVLLLDADSPASISLEWMSFYSRQGPSKKVRNQ